LFNIFTKRLNKLKKIAVIGSGFSGLAAAAFAARDGCAVTVFEKNKHIGGRARSFSEQGFTFDMGPSWYWMPDVFDQFFAQFGKKTLDYYTLKKLDPGFQIIYGQGEVLRIPTNPEELFDIFEQLEKGSAQKLRLFLSEAEFKYNVGMQQLVYKPAFSWMEFARWDVLKGVAKSHLFTTVSAYVRKYFKHPQLIALLEFPVLFLGAMPNRIPALYTLMNYSALVQGTFYPMGGMSQIIEAMKGVAEEQGVHFITEAEVSKINVYDRKVSGLDTSKGLYHTDALIASADYHHIEQNLLEEQYRNYSEEYWEKKTFAPSCLIYYIGVNKRIKNLLHHNLFFDTDFDKHSKEIYEQPEWPSDPLFYACCPSKTDDSVAPEGMENLFLLVPIATGLDDSESKREAYFERLIKRLEAHTGDKILDHIIYKKSYCVNDFVKDYNAYKGNAYGLANTLMQTAVLKPKLKNKQLKNMFYAGQLTVPGPGVPPSIISGQIAAEQINLYFKNGIHNETII
jgi:phytoene desaturase